jgi:hypothetical protein
MALLRVLYDFAAEEDGELNVVAGDVVRPVGAWCGAGSRLHTCAIARNVRERARSRQRGYVQPPPGLARRHGRAVQETRAEQDSVTARRSLASTCPPTSRQRKSPPLADDDGAADKDGWTLVEVVAGPRAGSSGFIPSGACAGQATPRRSRRGLHVAILATHSETARSPRPCALPTAPFMPRPPDPCPSVCRVLYAADGRRRGRRRGSRRARVARAAPLRRASRSTTRGGGGCTSRR